MIALLKKDEIGKVALISIITLLLQSGIIIGWSAIIAIASKHLGMESIPILGLGGRLFMLSGSVILLAFIDKFSQLSIFTTSCIGGAFSLIIGRYLILPDIHAHPTVDWQWIVYFLLILAAQGWFSTTGTTLLSILANSLFSPSQGVRIYPIFNTMFTIGGLLGGILLQFLPGIIGVENIIIVWSALFLCAIPVYLIFQKQYSDEMRIPASATPTTSNKFIQHSESFNYLFKTSFGKTSIFLALLVWMINPIQDFQYRQIMNHTFTSAESLTQLFGLFTIISSGSCVLVQIFVTKKIIYALGVFRSLIFVPIVYIIGFFILLISYTFWPSILLNYSSNMIITMIYFVASPLTFNAIPFQFRKKLINFLTGVINPAGYIVGSLIIIAIQQTSKHLGHPIFTIVLIPITGLVLAITLFLVVFRGRTHYIQTLVNNLSSDNRRMRLDTIEELEERKEPVAYDTLTTILLNEANQYDQDTIVKTMEVLGRLGNLKSLRILTNFLTHEDPRLRRLAISAIYQLEALRDHPIALYALKKELHQIFENDPSPAVRMEAGRFLIHHTPKEELAAFIDKLLTHPDPAARKAVFQTIGKLEVKFSELILIKGIKDPDPVIRGETIVHMWNMLEYRTETRKALRELLGSPNLLDKEQGFKTVIHVNDVSSYISKIEELTKDPDTRISALAGIAILFDESATPEMEEKAVQLVVEDIADHEYTEAEQKEMINLLTKCKESILDDILMASVQLPPEKRTIASHTLSKLQSAMDTSLEMENYLAMR